MVPLKGSSRTALNPKHRSGYLAAYNVPDKTRPVKEEEVIIDAEGGPLMLRRAGLKGCSLTPNPKQTIHVELSFHKHVRQASFIPEKARIADMYSPCVELPS